MNCQSCGKKLKKGENFCPECGYYNDYNKIEDNFVGDLEADDEIKEPSSMFNKVNIIDDDKKVNTYSLSDTPSNKKLTSFIDDRYIEAYIGEDYKWVMRKPINIYALLLSWMYFIYRKLYIIGILGLITTGLCIRFLPKFIIVYIVVVMLGSGILFNKIYEKVITKRVEKIIKKNDLTDNFSIEQLCQKKGGVNVPIALLIFFIFLAVLLLSYINIKVNNENTKFWEENTTNKANCLLNTKNVYNILEDNNIKGELKEAICEINKQTKKTYDIYLKLNIDSNIEYLYFKDEGEYLTLVGNTNNIEELEKRKEENKLIQGEEEFLEESKLIETKYKTMITDSNYEDQLIKESKNTTEKLHFIITQEEILR